MRLIACLSQTATAFAVTVVLAAPVAADVLHSDKTVHEYEGMVEDWVANFDENGDGRVVGEDSSTGAVYEYGREDPNVTSKTHVGSTVDGDIGRDDIDFSFTDRLFFYYNLPATVSALDQRDAAGKRVAFSITTEYGHKKHADQDYLDNHLNRFVKRPIASEPIIAYALQHTRFELIENRANSPSNTILNEHGKPWVRINENDLWAYGPVVLVQELLHAAIKKARYDGLFKPWHYTRVASLNDEFFSDYDGYIGTNGPKGNGRLSPDEASMLYGTGFAAEKAFAIGHTYYLLKKHLSGFTSGEKDQARKFFGDVENNIRIADFVIQIDQPPHDRDVPSMPIFDDDDDHGVRVVQMHTAQLYLLGSNVGQGKIDRFIDLFMNQKSELNEYIAPALARF